MTSSPLIDPPERRDRHLAARTMGQGETVVLPLPLVGSYERRTVSVAVLSFDLTADASPILVIELVHKLKLTEDMIAWKVIPSSVVGKILVEQGFVDEAWDDAGNYQSYLVWRAV